MKTFSAPFDHEELRFRKLKELTLFLSISHCDADGWKRWVAEAGCWFWGVWLCLEGGGFKFWVFWVLAMIALWWCVIVRDGHWWEVALVVVGGRHCWEVTFVCISFFFPYERMTLLSFFLLLLMTFRILLYLDSQCRFWNVKKCLYNIIKFQGMWV